MGDEVDSSGMVRKFSLRKTTFLKSAKEGNGDKDPKQRLQQVKALMWVCAYNAADGKVASMADHSTER